MNTFISIVAIVGCILFFALMAYSMKNDRKLAGFYKSIGAFGRIYAYLLLDFTMMSIAIPILFAVFGDEGLGVAVIVLFEVACVLGACLMYYLLFRRCRNLPKGRVLRDYFIMAFGLMTRVTLFVFRIFFRTWFALTAPTAYTVDGQTVYAYPGSDVLYDCHGYRVGVANSNRTEAVMDH